MEELEETIKDLFDLNQYLAINLNLLDKENSKFLKNDIIDFLNLNFPGCKIKTVTNYLHIIGVGISVVNIFNKLQIQFLIPERNYTCN